MSAIPTVLATDQNIGFMWIYVKDCLIHWITFLLVSEKLTFLFICLLYLREICQIAGFPWSEYFYIRTESSILLLYRNILVGEKPYHGYFTQCDYLGFTNYDNYFTRVICRDETIEKSIYSNKVYTVTGCTVEQIIYNNNGAYEDPKDAKKKVF